MVPVLCPFAVGSELLRHVCRVEPVEDFTWDEPPDGLNEQLTCKHIGKHTDTQRLSSEPADVQCFHYQYVKGVCPPPERHAPV